MIIIVTTLEKDAAGRPRLVASHGVDETTGRSVVLSNDHPCTLGAVFDNDLCEWVIRDPEPGNSNAPNGAARRAPSPVRR